jgi:hypothetical protein
MGDHFLVVAVGPFTGGASSREALPRRGTTLDRSHEAGMVSERHALAIAQDAGAVRAALLLLGRAGPATHVLPRGGLIVVAMGATQTATGGLGCAVGIIAPIDECLGVEVFVARVIGKDRDTPLLTKPLVVGGDIIGRISQLHLPRQDRDG